MGIPGTTDPDPQPNGSKSTAELLRDLSTQLTTLVHEEIALAKAELSVKGKRLGEGAGLFGVAALLGVLAFGALIGSAVAALSLVVAAWLAALLVAVGLIGLAGALALAGKANLSKGAPPLPEEAVASAKEDIAWIKDQTRSARS
jgi:lipopolysaccharide export LptBFGC system permease protein LptF